MASPARTHDESMTTRDFNGEHQAELVSWLREAAPYLHAHRGSVAVVYLSGAAVAADSFEHHVYDLALLVTLGIKVILVHGIRPQLEQRLSDNGLVSRIERDIRITDEFVLPHAIDAAGSVRACIEARLAQSKINSPMAGARIRVAGGSFVTARPLGVLYGIDYGHTGEVRRIDRESISTRLDAGELVLVSPLAHSPSGESFNLDAASLATQVAIEMKAEKLVVLSEHGPLCAADGDIIRQATLRDVRDELHRDSAESMSGPMRHMFEQAQRACQHGVGRVHLVDHQTDGGLLLELFSRDGVGTLISNTPFDRLRQATIDDVGGIISLIEPLEQRGVLVRRSRDLIEREIDTFLVVTRDEAIIACGAMSIVDGITSAELSCIAVSPEYAKLGFGERLLRELEKQARQAGATVVFVLTTQSQDWFKQQGFQRASLEVLPVARQASYDEARNSQILSKTL